TRTRYNFDFHQFLRRETCPLCLPVESRVGGGNDGEYWLNSHPNDRRLGSFEPRPGPSANGFPRPVARPETPEEGDRSVRKPPFGRLGLSARTGARTFRLVAKSFDGCGVDRELLEGRGQTAPGRGDDLGPDGAVDRLGAELDG